MIPVFRKRFFILLGAAFAPALLGIFFREFFVLQLFCYAALLGAVVYDFRTVPRKDELRPERRHEKYLSIGAENTVRIAVENISRHGALLEMRDGYPLDFSAGDDTMHLRVPPLSAAEARYSVKPLKKGARSFGALHARASGKLGLVSRQYRYDIPGDAVVYPDILELKKYLKMATLGRIEQIGYRRREPGGESEFDFLREYRQGDDYRRIHWKATAKRHFPVTGIYELEYNRNVMALLDCGRMMTTRYGSLTKLDYAVNATLILAAAAKNRKDLFGLTVFSDSVAHHVSPKRDTRLFTGILPALCAAEPDFRRTDYRRAYAFLKNRVRKNSIIFLFSELYNRTVSADLIAMLGMLSRHHSVHFVSFEEREEEPERRGQADIARWILQKDQLLEKEHIILDLSRAGVRTVRVNSADITRKVVNSYLAS